MGQNISKKSDIENLNSQIESLKKDLEDSQTKASEHQNLLRFKVHDDISTCNNCKMLFLD